MHNTDTTKPMHAGEHGGDRSMSAERQISLAATVGGLVKHGVVLVGRPVDLPSLEVCCAQPVLSG